MLSCLALVFRFNMIFQRHFNACFCKSNKPVWLRMNKELSDFTTLTYRRESGATIDLLWTGYRLKLFLYMLDEMFNVFKQLKSPITETIAPEAEMEQVMAESGTDVHLVECSAEAEPMSPDTMEAVATQEVETMGVEFQGEAPGGLAGLDAQMSSSQPQP